MLRVETAWVSCLLGLGCFAEPSTIPAAGTQSETGSASTTTGLATTAGADDGVDAADGTSTGSRSGTGSADSGDPGTSTAAGETAPMEGTTGAPFGLWDEGCRPPNVAMNCVSPLGPQTACMGSTAMVGVPRCAAQSFEQTFTVEGLIPGVHRFSLIDPLLAPSPDTALSITNGVSETLVDCETVAGLFVAPVVDIATPGTVQLTVSSEAATSFPLYIAPADELCAVHPDCCAATSMPDQCPDPGLTACVVDQDSFCRSSWDESCVAAVQAVCGAICLP